MRRLSDATARALRMVASMHQRGCHTCAKRTRRARALRVFARLLLIAARALCARCLRSLVVRCDLTCLALSVADVKKIPRPKRPVENVIQKMCNLSHDRSSCTVARSANRVILDPHFSPFVLPSRTLQLPAPTHRRRSHSQ